MSIDSILCTIKFVPGETTGRIKIIDDSFSLLIRLGCIGQRSFISFIILYYESCNNKFNEFWRCSARLSSVCHDYVEMKLQNRRSTKRIEEFTGIDLLNFSWG